MDCIWVHLKNVGPPFFQIYISFYHNVIYTAGKSFVVVAMMMMMMMMMMIIIINITVIIE